MLGFSGSRNVLVQNREVLLRGERLQFSVMPPPPESKFLQLFKRDQGRCVYCGLDLKADYDRFMMATEDHLVPGSVGGYKRDMDNLILSCGVCNRLKGPFVPSPAIDSVKQRRAYISAVREHIMKRRAEKIREFLKVTHPGIAEYQ